MRLARCLAAAAILLASADTALAVDRKKFRTCEKTGFCHRNRNRSPDNYAVHPDSLQVVAGEIVAKIEAPGAAHSHGPLDLRITGLRDGTVRLRVTEPESLGPPRYESPDILTRPDLIAASSSAVAIASQDTTSARLTTADGLTAILSFSPFKLEVLGGPDGAQEPVVVVSDRGLLHFEQRKHATQAPETMARKLDSGAEDANGDREVLDWGEDGKPIYADGDADDANADDASVGDAAEAADKADDGAETFDGHTDHRPNGATSVGIDVSFPAASHVYGLPEHATDFDLKSTTGASGGYSEPYRMYNLDVFEYEIDEPMALYGHIPVVVAHSSKATASVFFNNPSETFVDVGDSPSGHKQVHWISESGVIELFVMAGPRPADVFRQYAALTGTTPTPPMFAIAYHQCRWNYRDDKDVREVNAHFEEYDFPVDVIWLDIEHTDGKRYFTWDHNKFPNPIEMQEHIASFGRKMVTIVDPHIKRDNNYYIHSEATRKGYYIHNSDGDTDFNGWCWPGDSSYLDFTNPDVRSWWADQFDLSAYKGSTEHLFTWNDMNEPSVFNGPEVSMTKEALSLAGVEHREWHNLYGFYFHMATAEGLARRSQAYTTSAPHRPFVLSRAFYAGSQRNGAIWTGDNLADWTHLKISSHMLLSLNVAGLPFAGADVGGFFKNPSVELLERWYQAGAFQPFLRAHAHIDTKRREPWLFGEETLARIRKTIVTRYTLLPFWYTVFHQHDVSGQPVMRPLWALAPEDETTFPIGDQWLVGDALLVKPITDEGSTSASVYLPRDFGWYQFEAPHGFTQGGRWITESAPLDKIPVFQRAGAIIPRKMRVRRSTATMRSDPYSLQIALDPTTQSAQGSLHVDDETTLAYRDGSACEASFAFSEGVLVATKECGGGFAGRIEVERLTFFGVKAAPASVNMSSGAVTASLDFSFDASTSTLTVRKPTRSFMTVPFSVTIGA